MHYTLLHLSSAEEVFEVKTIYSPRNIVKSMQPELVFELKTFANIRQARNYINGNKFYELSDGRIISGNRWNRVGTEISKFTLQPKRYDDV
jgi:hypothetical protein